MLDLQEAKHCVSHASSWGRGHSPGDALNIDSTIRFERFIGSIGAMTTVEELAEADAPNVEEQGDETHLEIATNTQEATLMAGELGEGGKFQAGGKEDGCLTILLIPHLGHALQGSERM